MKHARVLSVIYAIALTVLATTSQASLVVPAGLNAGDTYHVIFVTSTRTDATSTDISSYDTFVQNVANAADIGSSIGVDWLALGSTATVAAIDHLSPLFTDTSAPIYNQNGDLVANNFAQLWSGTLDASVGYSEAGVYISDYVWTGSTSSGTAASGATLGLANPKLGVSSYTNSGWLDVATTPNNTSHRLYAVSEQLVVVPLPAAIWLFGFGLLGLIGVARKKTA